MIQINKLLSFFVIIPLLSTCTVEAFASKPPIVPTSHHADFNSGKLEKSMRTRAPSPPKKRKRNSNHSNNATFATEQQAVLQTELESTKPNSRSSLSLPTLRLPPPLPPERKKPNNFLNSTHNSQMTVPEISNSILSNPVRSLPSVPQTQRFSSLLTTNDTTFVNTEDDLEDGGIETAFPPAANDTSTSISSEEDFGSDVEIIKIAPSGQPSSQLFVNTYEENAATKKGNIAEIEKEIIDALNTVETLPIFDIYQLLNTIYGLYGHKISSELQNKIKELFKKIIARFIDLGTVTETIIALCETMDALSIISATNVDHDVIKEIVNDLVKQFADLVKSKPLVFENFYDSLENAINQIKLFVEKLKETQLLSEENLVILDSLDIRSENIVIQVERAEPNMQESRSFLDRLTSSLFPNSQREPTGNSTTQISPQSENEIPEPRSILDRFAYSLFPNYLCETPNDCDPGLPPLSSN